MKFKTAFFLFILVSLFAQKTFSQSYSLSTLLNTTYTPLVNPQVISTTWDTSLFLDQDLGVSNFNFADMNFNFDGNYPNGMLLFAAGVVAGSASNAQVDLDFDGFFVDIQASKSLTNPSAMSYQVSGSSPNRILKFEWKNAKLTYGDTSDYVNFQMWLYEGTSMVQARFGPSYVKNPSTDFGPGFNGPHIGIFFASTVPADNDKILRSFYLYGDPSNPQLNSKTFNVTVNGMPKPGTVYTLTYTGASGIESTNQLPAASINIYPNPAGSYINVENKNTGAVLVNISVIDVAGKTALRFSDANIKPGKSTKLDISALPKGLYFVKCMGELGTETTKLVIE